MRFSLPNFSRHNSFSCNLSEETHFYRSPKPRTPIWLGSKHKYSTNGLEIEETSPIYEEVEENGVVGI